MRKLLFIVLLLASLSPIMGCAQNLGWPVIKQQVRSSFPEVTQISTDSLAAWLTLPNASKPVLLDVRTEDEYDVSHLPGAMHVHPETKDLSALDTLPRDTPIVAYCSVGYRSSEMAKRLQEAGFSNVVNLEGSIFQWANEGRPVSRDGIEVRQVHPYDGIWGVLLNKELRAYEAKE